MSNNTEELVAKVEELALPVFKSIDEKMKSLIGEDWEEQEYTKDGYAVDVNLPITVAITKMLEDAGLCFDAPNPGEWTPSNILETFGNLYYYSMLGFLAQGLRDRKDKEMDVFGEAARVFALDTVNGYVSLQTATEKLLDGMESDKDKQIARLETRYNALMSVYRSITMTEECHAQAGIEYIQFRLSMLGSVTSLTTISVEDVLTHLIEAH